MDDRENNHLVKPQSKSELRQNLYDDFDVSPLGRCIISNILPILERNVDTENRYNISARAEILSEIVLYEAYVQEPKFKLFFSFGALIGMYDLFHPLPSQVYGILFIGFASIHGLSSSLRTPKMMAVELESETDIKGMPADYRAKAISSVSTNVAIVLLLIAVLIRVLAIGSVLPSEIISSNYAVGTEISPEITLSILLLIVAYLIRRSKKDSET